MTKILLYIDPGVGSLVFQILIGGIIATSLFFKNLWITIFHWFKKKKEK